MKKEVYKIFIGFPKKIQEIISKKENDGVLYEIAPCQGNKLALLFKTFCEEETAPEPIENTRRKVLLYGKRNELVIRMNTVYIHEIFSFTRIGNVFAVLCEISDINFEEQTQQEE